MRPPSIEKFASLLTAGENGMIGCEDLTFTKGREFWCLNAGLTLHYKNYKAIKGLMKPIFKDKLHDWLEKRLAEAFTAASPRDQAAMEAFCAATLAEVNKTFGDEKQSYVFKRVFLDSIMGPLDTENDARMIDLIQAEPRTGTTH